MRLEQQVGNDGGVHFIGCKVGEAGLRMLAEVGVRPTVESALLDVGEKIGWQPVAEAIALLDQCVKLAGLRMESERRGIAHAGSERRLVGAIGIEALNGCLRFGLDTEIARGAD